jgi:AAA domain
MTAQEFLQRAAKRPAGTKVIALWEGRWDGFPEYPTQSEADLALCSYIEQETGPDRDAIDRLFRESGLYRPKWDEPHHADGRTYGEGTIDLVLTARSPAPSADGGLSSTLLQRFKTAADLVLTPTQSVLQIAGSYIIAGALTKLDGKAKAAGKTTVALDLTRAILTGDPFLGFPTTRGPVVYLTEQSQQTFAVAMRRAGLIGHPDLHLLFHPETAGYVWSTVVEAAAQKCRSVGAKALIIDTFHQFAGLDGESENQSGAALKAMAPLQAFASEGTTGTLITAHERKGGGDIGESGRGSSAFTGGVDTVLQLTRLEGQGRPDVRALNALSRFDVPPRLLIERRAVDAADPAMATIGVPAEYIFVPIAQNAAALSVADDAALVAALPQTPAAALSVTELIRSTKLSRSVLQTRLDRLQQGGVVHRLGGGKKNNPYRFYAGGNGAGTPIPGGTQHQQ